MVKIIERKVLDDGTVYIEAAGTSLDDKPVSYYATGSVFIEVDTGDAYFYNEEADPGSEWVKVGGSDE